MLEDTKPPYDSTAAVAPSSQLEKIRGYDVELPFLKSVYLQFKRPHLLESRYTPFSFHTDHPDQLETLRELADTFPRTVFYALPLIETDSELDSTLDKTLFVKVECAEPETSRIRVHRDYYSPGNWAIDRVEGKVKNGEWYDFSTDCWRDWSQFENGLTSMQSGIVPWIPGESTEKSSEPVGVVLKREGEPAMYPDSERRVYEVIGELIDNPDFAVDHTGLTAGMFARA